MLWRLVVAAVALVGFLGGAAVVATQFEHDVGTQSGGLGSLPSIGSQPPANVKPFDLSNVVLPNGMKLSIPPGSLVLPNGSIQLPKNVSIPLAQSLLNNVNITLPRDGVLHIPNGTTFDGQSLHFPTGANGTLGIPNVGQYSLPSGSTLKLPADLAAQMRGQGLSGTLGSQSIPIPSGSTLTIPQMSPSGGSIMTNSGTILSPPSGGSFGLPTGSLGSGSNLSLPGGSTLNNLGALGLLAGIGYMSAQQAGLNASSVPPMWTGPSGSTNTSSDVLPVQVYSQPNGGAIQKGVPFYVTGYVKTLKGTGLANVPVTIYVNQTGTGGSSSIGSTQTDANGNFRVQVTIPSNYPTGDYEIMAESAPTQVGSVSYAAGWG
ncbi:MAG: hypothetical protein ACYDDF_03715 [Thermoplasmatota archaeon]